MADNKLANILKILNNLLSKSEYDRMVSYLNPGDGMSSVKYYLSWGQTLYSDLSGTVYDTIQINSVSKEKFSKVFDKLIAYIQTDDQ